MADDGLQAKIAAARLEIGRQRAGTLGGRQGLLAEQDAGIELRASCFPGGSPR